MSYVKKYDVGQIKLDLPYANYIHELPLFSFGDVRHTVNLSLVYNSANSNENAFNIANGFKLNMQKRIKFTGSTPTEFVDESGKSVTILNNSGVYTFDDESQRIMRVREITVIPFDPNPKDNLFPAPMTDYIYTVEYPDFSKEEYSSSGKLTKVYDKYDSAFLTYTYSNGELQKIVYGSKYIELKHSGGMLTSISYIANEDAAEDEENIPTIAFNFTTNNSTITHYSDVEYIINMSSGYSVEAKEGSSVVKSLSVTTDTANKTIALTDENGKRVTYSFSDPIDANDPSRMVDITDKNGVVTRVQFEGDEAVCSYELMSNDNDMFIQYPYDSEIGAVYSGTVSINKNGFNGTQGINDGIKLDKGTNLFEYWSCILPGTYSYYGDFLISGWVYPTTDVVCNFVVKDVFNNVEYEGYSVDNLIPETWNYVSFITNIRGAGEISVSITSEPQNRISSLDFRLTFEEGKIYSPYGTNHFTRDSDVLIVEGSDPSADVYLLPEECKFYNGNTLMSHKLTTKDVLRYKINQMYGSSQNEIYYNDCRGVISNAGAFTIGYTKDGVERITPISKVAVGKKRIANGNTYVSKTNYYLNDENLFDLITKDLVNDECYRRNRYDDKFDLVYSVVDGISTFYSRNSTGLVVTQTTTDKNASNPIVTSCTYDSTFTKLLSTTDEFGNKTEYETDDTWGIVTKITVKDSAGTVQSVITDSFDDDKCTLKSRAFSNADDARSTAFGYDKGYIKNLTQGDPDNSISFGFTYDAGKLASVTKGSNTVEEHDHTDTTTESFYPNEANEVYSTKCTFDKYGRLIDVEGLITNTYNPAPMFGSNGNLNTLSANASSVLATSVDKTNNQTSKYHYNERGQASKKQISNSSGALISEETFAYDGVGRLTDNTCTYDISNSKSVGSHIEYAKEETNPLVDKTIEKYTYKVNGSNKAETQYRYDAYNRNDKKTYVMSGRQFTKEITFTKTRPATVIDKSSTSTIGNTSYTYDAMGRIKSINNGETITYEYDSYGQLISETNYILDKTFQYVYNEIGNIDSVTTYPHVNGVASATGTTVSYSYNTAHPDRLTRVGSNSIAYNSMGCIASYNSRIYRWERGKLAGYTRGSMSQPGSPYENCVYTYNALGQRVSKTYTYDPNPAVTNDASYTYTTTYTYDNSGRLIREYTDETHNLNGASTRELIYLYDESGVIGVVYSINGTVSGVYYYLRNLQGDVIGIYDTNGTKVVEYAYDAFGNCATVYGLASSIGKYNPIRYRGYYCDIETDWYFLNSRYYAPELRRFISPDDSSYLNPENVNGLNLYCYCNNDPVNYCDPSGCEPLSNLEKWIIGGIALAAAITITVLTGGALTPVFIGMGVSILSGALIGGAVTAYNGEGFWSGFADGAANGAMWGGISALIGASVGAIKYGISARGAVKGTQHFTTITKGQVFDRYGRLAGKYITDVGTPITKLALPATNTGVKTTLMATKNFRVITGVIADAFGGTGGGIQYVMRYSIDTLIQMGWLVVIEQ